MNPTFLALLFAGLVVAEMAVAILFCALCLRELRVVRRGLGALDEGAGRRTASVVAGLAELRDPVLAIRTGVDELSPNGRKTIEHRPSPALAAAASAAPPPVDMPRMAGEDRDSEPETRLVRQPTAAELAAAGLPQPRTIPRPDPPALAAAGLDRPQARLAPPGRTPHPPPVKRAATVMGLPPPAGAPPQSTHRPPPATVPTPPRRTGTGTLMSMPAQSAPPSSGASIRPVCRMCEGSGAVRTRSGQLDDCRSCNGSGYLDPSTHPLGAGDEREARLPG